MIIKIQNFIIEQNLFAKDDRLLLAVSGGLDSMVMVSIMNELGYSTGIAHCNFQLRDEQSDLDAKFVKEFAGMKSLPFHQQVWNTSVISSNSNESIQMTARNLRYQWLTDLALEKKYDFIITAHHQDDHIETVLLNLIRGSGIKGITGIPVKRDNIVRPLLCISKLEIKEYAQSKGIDFREDSSNAEIKYDRNVVRNEIIPLFEKLNPSFKNTMLENITRFADVNALLLELIKKQERELVLESGTKQSIQLDKLPRRGRLSMLYYLLKPYGFTPSQISQSIREETKTGACFYSEQFRMVKDRARLIITPLPEAHSPLIPISLEDNVIHFSNGILSIQELNEVPKIFSTDPHTATFDLDKIQFPMLLRKWKPGDVFCPLGLEGHQQKLQDFFTNQKCSIIEKENAWILISSEEICWILGMRIDHRFRITNSTKKAIQLSIAPATQP